MNDTVDRQKVLKIISGYMVRGGIPAPINAVLNDIYYEVECLPGENEEEYDE